MTTADIRESQRHCWSHIGVWSSQAPTCPLLQEVVHCRNCSVYTGQGRTLLDRPIPPGRLEEWTGQVAQTPQEEGALSESVLIFRLGDEHFALPTRFFEEVISLRPVHTIPHRSGKVIKGFVAFRGRLELCVSMGRLLGVDKSIELIDSQGARAASGSRILVISRGEEARYLFLVSAVIGTHRYELSQLQTSLSESSHVFAYLRGVFPHKDISVGLIDADLIFEALSRSLAAR